MLAIIFDFVGAFLAAKYIQKIWVAIPVVILVSFIGTVAANMLTHFINPDLFPPGEVFASIIVGAIWHPVLALIAYFLFRRKYKNQTSPSK